MKDSKTDGKSRRRWEKPEIRSLKFRQTLGGTTQGQLEGFPWDGSM